MKAFNKILGILALLAMIGCAEDPEITVLKPVYFEGELSQSTDNMEISEENQDDVKITLNWEPVDYFIEAPVTYSYQITTVDDTSKWSNSLEREIGDDQLEVNIYGRELNELVMELGVEAGEATDIAFRIKSYMNKDAYSEIIVVNVTAFATSQPIISYPSLYIAGDYQGWDISMPDSISSKNDDGVYEGYLYIPEGGTLEFKLYAQRDWSPTSYGDGGDGTLIVANYAGDNFIAPSAGYYLFAVDVNTMEYILTKIDSWGIMGEATPDGWNSDTDLTFDPESGVWSVTCDMKATGFFKFRANNDWQLDFGLGDDGIFDYVNHPWLEYVDKNNLTIANDGNYTITLDLSIPGNYRYNIKRN